MAPGDNLMLAIKILGAIAAVVVIAAVAAGALMYFRVIPIPGPILALLIGAKSPEYSARYYPPDTIAYAWVTLVPGGGQLEDMQDIWSRFKEFREFRRFIDELREDFEDDTGIDFEAEVQPWIGPDASVAFIDYDTRRDVALIAATIAVRDSGAARDFLDAWLEYMEDEEGADFDSDSYKDFEIWADESEYQVYGLSDDLLVFSTTESGIREMIDGIKGDTERSLADNENFKAARAALPQRRFASAYVDYDAAIRLQEDFYPDELYGVGSGNFVGQQPEWVSASATWLERAVVFETFIPVGIDSPLQVANLKDPARLAPDDAVVLVAGTFDANLDHWRTFAREYDVADLELFSGVLEGINRDVSSISSGDPPELTRDDDMADVLDLGLWLVEDLTGIDLEASLFDHLDGEVIVAVADSDFAKVESDPLVETVDAVVMLSYREGSEAELAGTMKDIANLIEDNLAFFLETDTVRVGVDTDATIFDFHQELINTSYTPGYVLNDGYLAFGATADALEATVARQRGGAPSLASVDEYGRAVGHLPEAKQFLAYVNLQSILRQFEPSDFDMTGDEFEVLTRTLGSAAISSHSPHCVEPTGGRDCLLADNDGVTRITAVLTLFPE